MRTKLSFLLALALLGMTPMAAVADDGALTHASALVPSTTPITKTPTQPQNPSVTVTAATAGTSGVGLKANVWGRAAGAPNADVWTEVRLSNGKWSTSQKGKTNTNGNYALELTYGKYTPGTQTFRVGVRTSGGTVYSPQVKLTRAGVTAKTAGATGVGARANIWGTATGAPNTKVFSQVRLANGKWSTSQISKTNASGFYSLPMTYGQNTPGLMTWRVGVTTSGGTVYSSPVTLRRISVTAKTAGSKPVGAKTYAWGRASGAPNAKVSLQVRLPSGKWSTSQIGKTSSTGSYSLPLTYGATTPGTYVYRVVVNSNGATVYSPQTRLTRTRTSSRLDSRCMSGRVMCASKKDRKLYWVVNGQVKKTMDARFGCPSAPSDNGSFKVFWKSYNHTSTLYGSWMPRAMFYNGGEAVHYSPDFKSRGYAGCSHGCVNIRDWDGINWLYNQVRNGDKVVVY
ncbi:L,D-transpeptidase family protein [Enemella sp. A6]|uniref:L,D-transpeptidase n=1 Tax=Enemella sp. A6 TaxID=3440152 RepID=UPI003EBDD6FF